MKIIKVIGHTSLSPRRMRAKYTHRTKSDDFILLVFRYYVV